ncbi:hypothetical protein ABW19_dt0210008 [Dactylella cylindrospora]|nr:hypothetical protein ABW19_dt0210008 [Dactylella cylindrospora]
MSNSQDSAVLSPPSQLPPTTIPSVAASTVTSNTFTVPNPPDNPSNNSQDTQQTSRPPINPSNPLKRKLSDNMEALIAQAKASRTATNTDAKATQAETIYDKLERELTCSICCELFKDPVTILNCLHNFCGSCVVPWSQSNSSCPSCRSPMRECRDAFALKPLLDMLLKEKPELAHSEEDLEASRSVYKPGQKITAHQNVWDSDPEEDEEEEPEPETEYWQPCPCCAIGEQAHPTYTCNTPINQNDPTEAYTTVFKEHKKCYTCDRETPYNPSQEALRKARCACCAKAYCGLLFEGCEGDPDGNFLSHLDTTGFYGPANRPQINWFSHNFYEQDSLKRWIESDSNNHTWQSLGKEMLNWVLRDDDGVIVPWPATVAPVTRGEYVCRSCLVYLFDRYLTDFLVAERESLGWRDIRTKCWYGKNCRTQRHNPDHCARLNHVCDETPLAERLDNSRIAAVAAQGPPAPVTSTPEQASTDATQPSQPQAVTLPSSQQGDASTSAVTILDDDPEPSS